MEHKKQNHSSQKPDEASDDKGREVKILKKVWGKISMCWKDRKTHNSIKYKIKHVLGVY